MRWVAPVLLLSACASEHERLLRTWHGVYRVSRTTQNDEGCAEEGPEIAGDVTWFEVVTEAGPEADLVDLRRCDGAEDCERVGFATFVAPVATPTTLDGGEAHVWFTGLDPDNGLCQVLYEAVTITRPEAGSARIRVELRDHVATDVAASGEEACWDLVDTMLADPDGCDALRVIEARRVAD